MTKKTVSLSVGAGVGVFTIIAVGEFTFASVFFSILLSVIGHFASLFVLHIAEAMTGWDIDGNGSC